MYGGLAEVQASREIDKHAIKVIEQPTPTIYRAYSRADVASCDIILMPRKHNSLNAMSERVWK